MADAQLELNALKIVNDATNSIAANEIAISQIITTVGQKVDDLVAKQQAAGVPQEIVDQTTSLGDNLTAISSALGANVAALQGIASKGASNPVPVDVPPPITIG